MIARLRKRDSMRKLKIIEHISLDGVIQVSGGPGEDGDFPYAAPCGSCANPKECELHDDSPWIDPYAETDSKVVSGVNEGDDPRNLWRIRKSAIPA
jgi:hypothetical protein